MNAITAALPFNRTKEKKEKEKLPEPLVSPLRHPFVWMRQRVGLLLALLIGAHIGTLIVVAVYYLAFETYAPFTNEWHRLIANDNLRHAIRNVGEGLLGGTLGQLLVYNAFKKQKTKLNFLDKIEMKLHLPNAKDNNEIKMWQLVIAPLIIIVYAIPGFGLGFEVAHLLHNGANHVHNAVVTLHPTAVHHDYWQKVVTSNWDQKVIGVFASIFLGRRPIKAYAADTQLWFASRRVCLDKPLRFYHTPVFKARYNKLKETGVDKSISHSGWQATVVLSLVFIGLCLAGFGFHVINDIAK